jgi:hypothetical protein
LVGLLAASRRFDWSLAAWVIIVFTGFSPVMLNNLYGQTNLMYLALLSLFVLAYMRSFETSVRSRVWEIAAALALSLAISIRILPLAILALTALQRRYRFVALTIGFAAIETAAAGVVVGFTTEWRYFTSHIFSMRGLENMREISLLALGQKLAGPTVGKALFATALLAGIAAFLALVLPRLRRLESSAVLPIAFVIASMVLFSPLLEYHHYTIILVPYTLILADLARRDRLGLFSALPVFISWAIVSGANQLSHFQYGPIAFAALAGAALIWGYSVYLIAKSKDEG